MAQFSDSRTTGGGVIVNAVLDTTSNTTTYTVTAPNGAVATASQNASGGVNAATLSSIQQQLAQGGADAQTFSIGLRTALSTTANNTNDQATTAPPGVQETQPIPASTAADPQVPQPGNNVVPQSFFQRDALPSGSDTFPTPAENLASLREAGFGPAPVTAADQANIDALNRIEANRANNIGADTDAGLSPYGEENDLPEVYSPDPLDAELDAAIAEQQALEADAEIDRISAEFRTIQDDAEIDRISAEFEQIKAQAAQEAAIKAKAKEQATFQARYKQTANQDWRVRLSLGPNAQYLYNAGTPRGSAAGILSALTATDGVIFPYTPSITTTYSANYEQYDLVHSNYRGIFYKNSRVGDINIRGTFTAQDTNEANYLLAVIHFFRSATKMFYGQDGERGTPPPVCLLNGLGTYQFSDHPVVISSFNYTTPNDVDYIRAQAPNNYGSNLLNRRAAVASNPGGSSLAGLNRLLNAVSGGLNKYALPNVPAPSPVNQTVNNTAGATYVPTKIEVDITLIPVQTRSQVSKQFSLKGFANGQLLKGGFW